MTIFLVRTSWKRFRLDFPLSFSLTFYYSFMLQPPLYMNMNKHSLFLFQWWIDDGISTYSPSFYFLLDLQRTWRPTGVWDDVEAAFLRRKTTRWWITCGHRVMLTGPASANQPATYVIICLGSLWIALTVICWHGHDHHRWRYLPILSTRPPSSGWRRENQLACFISIRQGSSFCKILTVVFIPFVLFFYYILFYFFLRRITNFDGNLVISMQYQEKSSLQFFRDFRWGF